MKDFSKRVSYKWRDEQTDGWGTNWFLDDSLLKININICIYFYWFWNKTIFENFFLIYFFLVSWFRSFAMLLSLIIIYLSVSFVNILYRCWGTWRIPSISSSSKKFGRFEMNILTTLEVSKRSRFELYNWFVGVVFSSISHNLHNATISFLGWSRLYLSLNCMNL